MMNNHLPRTRQEGEIKKHNLYSLKTGDEQYAVHMQTVAGGEHGPSNRSGKSSWMEQVFKGQAGEGITVGESTRARKNSSEETL